MHYRNLTSQGELDIYRELARQAFALNVPPEDRAFWESEAPFTSENTRGMFDDSGALLAGMRILDGGAIYYRSERPVPAALIASVVAPPEHRRKGYVRELFTSMYAEQRERGVALSALYPFEFPFYRSFGYELAHDSAHYTVNIGQFAPWGKAAKQGRFVPATFDRDLETLDAIYRERARRGIGYLQRDRKWWFWKLIRASSFVPAYIYHNPEGQAAGYIVYYLEERERWERDMIVGEMGALDRASQEALYGFIYNHDSQAGRAVFSLPVDAAFASELPDPRQAEVRVYPGHMLRLLDVEGAFRQRAFAPEAQGEFTFAVADQMAPANTGAYRVRVRDGAAEIERLSGVAQQNAGLELDARALAQLYAGYIGPVRAAAIGRIAVTREADLQGMQAALSPCGQPAPFMADGF